MLIKLSKHVAIGWCLKYHYLHRKPSISYAYGWVENNHIKAILTIGKPASPPLCRGVCGSDFSRYVYEVNRVVASDQFSKLSKFIAAVLRDLPNLILVSYADSAWSHVGYIYQATNWLYTGFTKPRTDVDTKHLHPRHYDKDSIDYTARENRSGKHRYVYFTGRKSFKKLARKHLKYPVLSYPKGDTKRYHIDWQSNFSDILPSVPER